MITVKNPTCRSVSAAAQDQPYPSRKQHLQRGYSAGMRKTLLKQAEGQVKLPPYQSDLHLKENLNFIWSTSCILHCLSH